MDTFVSNPDPLGLDVKGRAREKRLAASLQGLLPVGGPLPDPNWEGYLQSLDDQNVSSMQAGDSPSNSNQLTGFGPTDVVNRKGFSQAPLAGLKAIAASQAAPLPQEHDAFMAQVAANYAKRKKR